MKNMGFARHCLVVGLTVLFLSILGFLPMAHLASAQTDNEPEKIDAGTLFKEHCAKCHGKDGRAKTFRGKLMGARNLTDEKWQAGETDEEIKEAIMKGPELMPSFEGKLTPAEIEAMVGYVRSLNQGRPETNKE